MKPKYSKIKPLLWLLMIIFIVLLGCFIAANLDKRGLFPLIAILGLALLLLGIVLIVLTKRQKIKGRLKIFLLLTGISVIGPLFFSILHNLFYALAIVSSNIPWLEALMEFLHAAFFIISLIISPIGFLVGAIGSIILLRGEK